MPFNTWNNLNKEKRNFIFEKSLEYFSDNDFNTASITEMVKELQIAKGSIYQYFQNKEDLYKYLLESAIAKKVELYQVLLNQESLETSIFIKSVCILDFKFKLEFHHFNGIINRSLYESGKNSFAIDHNVLIDKIYLPVASKVISTEADIPPQQLAQTAYWLSMGFVSLYPQTHPKDMVASIENYLDNFRSIIK